MMTRKELTSLTEKPAVRRTSLLFQAALCVLIILGLLRYLGMWSAHPYYFMWDMDLVTVTDSVLINSELLPDHINHTGFGMYLLFFISQRVTELFYDLSVTNLADIGASLNPVTGMAELIDFFRLHSPFVVLGLVLAMWGGICRLVKVSPWLSLLVLAVLGTHSALLYHASMIRTELYSVFFWSVTLLLIGLLVKTRRILPQAILLLVAGVFLGLCFITKVQSLLYVAALGMLFFIAKSLADEDRPADAGVVFGKWSRWVFGLSLLNLTFFLIVAFAAFRTEIPKGIGSYETGYGVTPVLILSLVALVGLAIVQIALTLRKSLSPLVFTYSTMLNLIMTGFLLCFLLHLLLYSDVHQSLKYMLWNFKMVFFRQSDQIGLHDIGFYWGVLMQFMRYNRTPYIFLICLTVFLPLARRMRLVRLSRGQLVLLVLLTVTCLVNSVVLSRVFLRDTIWQGTLLNFLNVFFIVLLMARCSKLRKLFQTAGIVLLLVLLSVNYTHAADMPDRVDANYNQFGWVRDRLFYSVFSGNQLLYYKAIRKPYTSPAVKASLRLSPVARVSSRLAIDYRQTRRLANYVFHNQDITLRNIGMVLKDAPVWTADRQWRISSMPEAFKHAILIDNGELHIKNTGRFDAPAVVEQLDEIGKLLPAAPTDLLAVLTRTDVVPYIFVHAEDVALVATGHVKPTNYRITVKKGAQTRELHGLRITNYSEIPLHEITNPFFFVLVAK